ncbi:hypothetical protein FKM82_028802 [Ascaphus truei]
MEGESWRELGREELEHQYSPSHWSPRMDKDSVIEAHVRETAEGTRAARARTQTSLNISYGDSESEKLDMYLPQGQPTEFPLLIYIHGGYWQFLSVMVWGCLVASAPGQLAIIDTTTTSALYQKILAENVRSPIHELKS